METGDQRDEDLMAQVVEGRNDLLDRLIRRHANPLLTFIIRMVGDRHRAEELFQEVFLTVWLKRHQYQYPRPFRPWLYTIALNRCRAQFRLRTPRPDQLNEEPADLHSPADHAIADETAHLVSHAVTCLPQQQRAVVVLRIWQGLPYHRIAEMVGCDVSTARSHMHHGLTALRKALRPLVEEKAT